MQVIEVHSEEMRDFHDCGHETRTLCPPEPTNQSTSHVAEWEVWRRGF